MPTTVLSWNVNGIRSAVNKGFSTWLKKAQPDILCLQETRATPDDLDPKDREPKGYTSHWMWAKKKGYSGVGVFTREEPLSVQPMGKKEFDNEGRVIIIEYPRFTLINAYYPNSEWKHDPIRPWTRAVDDQVFMTQRDASILELVLGTRGRSGQQMDIFQAVYGPANEDGYPRLLYDKRTGVIDKGVIDYWRENYDLRHILERDWPTLGPKLRGKLHIYMGDMDTYFLEEATLLLEQFLEGTNNPYYGGTVQWGQRQPHCWTGAPPGQSSLEFVLPQMEHCEVLAHGAKNYLLVCLCAVESQ